jgi:hypothetical protein
MSSFGSGSNSNGQFWYGSTTNFPGFLYKKNVGVGGRRSTKFSPGGNTTCNTYQYLYNKYKPGQGGVGASSIANRRAKNRHATICNKSSENNCYPCYMTLGQYNRFLYNPNGVYPCPDINSYSMHTPPSPPHRPTILTFSSVGTTTWVAPVGVTLVEYLVVGGGGGGGGGHDTGGGGGGGGGMVRTGYLSVTPGNSYSVIVGGGGAASTNSYPFPPLDTSGGKGGDSEFSSVLSLGGQGGKGSRIKTGGSGTGGAAAINPNTESIGGSGGGSAATSAGGSGGGGGGASGVGSNGVTGTGGAGGTGVTSSISGSSITYGIGGNGARGNTAITGASGTANRGNGGSAGSFGSGGARNGGAGGSGIVIISY